MYSETIEVGNSYREEYAESLEKMIKNLQKKSDVERRLFFEKIKSEPEKYRTEFKKMLGWPLTECDNELPEVKSELVITEGEMNIYRLSILLPIGIKFYGMFFEHIGEKKLPLVVVQHGALGTPEACSGILNTGSGNYNDMVMRVFNKDVNVFAPQLLLWDKKRYKVEYDRINIDARLKQIGSSITAVEIYGIMKTLDYFTTLDCVDAERMGMLGFSYGSFYTLCTTAIDVRIKAAFACSQYNNRYKYSWVDWTWKNSAKQFMDNEIACLVYPRYLGIYVGKDDPVFDCESACEEYEKLKNMIDKNWIDFGVFEGKHEFIKEDEKIDKFLDFLKSC